MPLNSILSQLETAQLIRQTGEADLAYIFKNVLSQQAAYQSLLTKNRRELHLCVAETYEKLYADRLDENAALLAQHYAEAGDHAKTYEYSVRAGDGSARVYANAEALMHYTRAIEIGTATGAGDLSRLYLSRGRALELSGQYDAALKNYEEMETLGHTRGDRAMELDALVALATIRSTPNVLFDATLAQMLSDWALKVAREIGDRAAEAKILWNMMNLCFFSLRPKEGIEFGEHALVIARELGLTERKAYILNDINRLYLATGEIAKARQAVEEARPLWESLNNLPMLADNYGSAAEIGQYSGDLNDAYAKATQAAELARSIGNSWTLSYALATQAFVNLERGEMDEAFRLGFESIDDARQAGFIAGVGIGMSEIGMAYAGLGQVERGLEMVEQVLKDMGNSFDIFRPWILTYLARLYSRAGRPQEADATLDQARENFSLDHPVIYFSAPITMAVAELAFAKQEYAHVIDVLETAMARNEKLGVRFFWLDMLLALGRALEAVGQLDRASEVYARGLGHAQQSQTRRVLWQILLAQSRIAAARGEKKRAQELRAQSREVVDFIASHLRDEKVRGSFLSLPDVRAVME